MAGLRHRALPAPTVFCLVAVVLCAGASPVAGQQDQDLGWKMRVARSLDDPWPVFRVLSKYGDSGVDALGKFPLADVPVAVYKVADFAREVSAAAVDRQDARLNANLIVLNADAVLLKSLRDRGIDPQKNPDGVAASKRLHEMLLSPEERGEGALAHLDRVVNNDLSYSLCEVGISQAISRGFDKLIDFHAGEIDKALPLGDEAQAMLGNRSQFASGLRRIGWRKLGARAARAKFYTDALTHSLIHAALDKIVTDNLEQQWGDTLYEMFHTTLRDHPSQLRRIAIQNPELVAAMAVSVAIPAEPAPAPPAPAAPAPPEAAPGSDPVVDAIYAEDGYIQTYSRPQSRTTIQSISKIEPPARQPEAPSAPTAAQIEWQHHWDCAGAGNKPGCGGLNWDGR